MDARVLGPQLIPCQTWLLGPLSRFRGQRPGEVLSSCLQLISLGKGCLRPFLRWHNWGGQYDLAPWLPAEGGHWSPTLDMHPRKQPQPLGTGLTELIKNP